jgi:hypothetical protein
VHQAYPYCTSLWCLRIEEHHPVPPGSVGHSNITNTVHQANPYCTSLWCLRIEKHHPLPPGSVGHLNITNTVHQANPYCTSSYCSRIEKHHSVPSGAVLVSNSTTQFHLVLSTYQAGFSLHKILDYTSVMYYLCGYIILPFLLFVLYLMLY